MPSSHRARCRCRSSRFASYLRLAPEGSASAGPPEATGPSTAAMAVARPGPPGEGDGTWVADITGQLDPSSRPAGMRVIPSARSSPWNWARMAK
jgi:hypothetical protein